ncbi:hypothetical protein Syun_012702 [Stephania yunnanensis]|uniref:Uncharacterized protein n=1 Tax=Stephania yunnanensis TaxID=152371 RepID=A0AAP0PGM4_9MAGN
MRHDLSTTGATTPPRRTTNLTNGEKRLELLASRKETTTKLSDLTASTIARHLTSFATL